MHNRKSIVATVLSLGLTACSVSPRYKQPTVALPKTFTAPDTTAVNITPEADVSDPEFWHSLLDLLDAQRVKLQAEDAYAESHSDSALSAVLLYKSLAGGWPQHLPRRVTGGRP
jgi:uncharacterized lipoprotein